MHIILVADDDKIYLESMKERLELRGYMVFSAENGCFYYQTK